MRALVLLTLVLSLAGCSKSKPSPAASESPSRAAVAPAAASAAVAPAVAPGVTATPGTGAPADDRLSLASGAFVVEKGSPVDSNGAAWFLFDEDPRTGFTSADGAWNAPIVVELDARTRLRELVLDTASVELDARIPKTIEIAVSDTNAREGFEPVATISPAAEPRDGQRFAITNPREGRWVRVRIVAMRAEGTTGFAQIMELRGLGDRVGESPALDVTGTYDVPEYGPFHLRQEGSTITGCMGGDDRPIVGGIEGRVVRFTWNAEYDTGPTVVVSGPDGSIFGGWWKVGGASDHPAMSPFEGRRTARDPGTCRVPTTSGAAPDPIADELARNGRVRLYGVLFDTDSDRLRNESKATLDRVTALLRAQPTLAITIEGHTDSTSTPEHNQDLSARRATSVKRYLEGAGIDAGRLASTGYGETRPVATNDSALGRAANRRVEIATR